ncbi:ParB/RepB/Spo0J family partition protein [Streptomyces sp. NPDC002917]|uniref:ParB/RepB/Spo0J family partition protein n=1 Tax=Streptomyces sp. NPDC002917 TaxID=3364671 RepID=UPI0036B4D130
MSKASALGAGSSFQAARGGISARRAAINASAKAPTEGAPPPVELPVDVISLNPDNPRSRLGDLTSLAGSIRDHGQKTAISIMGRFAYLEANPGRDEDLEPDTRYVVIDGNSRLAAAREAGRATIKVMLDDALGSNPDEILESALVANIHRNDLDHLDEARALEKLLKVHGTQEALAARLHRTQGWVSQRLSLLNLTDELKQKLASGEEPASLLRRVGSKKPEEQADQLERLKAKQVKKATGEATGGRAPKSRVAEVEDDRQGESRSGEGAGSEPGYYGVMNQGGEAGQVADPVSSPLQPAESAVSPVTQPGAGGTASSGAGKAALVRLPSHDPEVLSDLVISELDAPARRRLTELLVDYKIAETTRMRARQISSAQ